MRWSLLFVALWPGLAHAGLFDREDPRVARGNEAYARGDYQAALEDYESAAKDRPDAVTDFDRGAALLRLGRPDEARKAFGDALAHGARGELASRAYANLGQAQAEQKKVDDALRSYRRALEINPGDEKARHDLGVLLARKQEQKKKQDQKKDDQQKKDQDQKQAGSDKDRKEDEKKDPGAEPRQSEQQEKADPRKQAGQDEQKQDEKQAGQEQKQDEKQAGQEQKQDEKQAGQDEQKQDEQAGQDQQKQDQQQAVRPMPPGEAARLLDSVREGEKSFQLWRHQKNKRRSDAQKDW